MKISIMLKGAVIRVSLVVLISLFFVACAAKKERPYVKENIQEIEFARVAMVNWLECEECTENQLETVLKYSTLLQPMLISTLHKGVAPASEELYKHELEKRYDELIAYSKTHPDSKPTLPKQDFVNLYLGNLTAQYQTRSAQALSAIGGEKSRQALQEALNKIKRDDVKQAIQQALKKIR